MSQFQSSTKCGTNFMANVLPTDDQVTLYVADDVRQELNNKITLSGFYTGNSLNVKDIGPNIIMPLSFLVLFTVGEGAFKFKLAFRNPAGQEIFERPEVFLPPNPADKNSTIPDD